jgi:hypothetical protein
MVGTDVMYAGQAIMVKSCANGNCHSELASRETRYGAPAGLDFDIQPALGTGMIMPTPDGRDVYGTNAEDLARLRRHQRVVFDKRHLIWEQVERGLMPPGGKGEPFKQVSAGTILETDEMHRIQVDSTGGCTLTNTQLGPITSSETKEELKKWLACGSPVIEVNVNGLTSQLGGLVGDQTSSCSMPLAPTFDNVFSEVIMPSCVTNCHAPGGGREQFDLSTIDVAYDSIMGSDGAGGVPSNCTVNDSPMVTPSDPDMSYFYAKVGGGGEFCDRVMPYTTLLGLAPTPLDLVRRWIEAGAPAPGVAVDESDASVPTGDAGGGEDGGAGDGGL